VAKTRGPGGIGPGSFKPLREAAAEARAEMEKWQGLLARPQADFAQLATAHQAWNKQIRESTRELARVQRAVQWRQMVAESGRMGAQLRLLKDQAAQFGKALADAGKGASLAAVAAGAALGGMAREASPQVFEALAGWTRVLAAEIGSQFVPAVAGMVRWVREWIDWWRGLSDETKGLLGGLAKVGTALLIVGAVGPKIAAAVGAITVAVKGLSTAFLALARNPFAWKMLALAGAAAAIFKLGQAIMGGGGRTTAEGLREQAGELQGRDRLSAEEIAGLPEDIRKAVAGGNQKALGDWVKGWEKELAQSREEQVKTGAGVGPQPRELELQRRVRLGLADRRVAEAERGLEMAKAAQRTGAAGGQNLFGSMTSAQFMGIEQVRKSAIEKALNVGKSPWEAEQLRLQQEANRRLQGIEAGVKDTANNTKDRRPPVGA
jgi:hypothetical protein